MSFRVFKYLSPCLLYAGAIASFLTQGFAVWLPLVYAWIVIPALELFVKPILPIFPPPKKSWPGRTAGTITCFMGLCRCSILL
jgi:hypothetical protein